MGLKIIHTSDWHLGKKLHNIGLIEEQILFLNWLKDTIINENIDLLIIAGDIFDTPHPSAKAIKAYFEFLNDTTSNSDCLIYLISGNHDSGSFLEAPSPFLEIKNVKVIGSFSSQPSHHVFNISTKNNYSIGLMGFPYFRTRDILDIAKQYNKPLPKNDSQLPVYIIETIQEFIKKSCDHFKKENHLNIFIGHYLFGKYELNGTEQGLFLSGVDSIPFSIIDERLDYLALGHAHRSQVLKKDPFHAIYSGSPMKFRFGEKGVKKLARIIINPEKEINFDWINIPEFKPIIHIDVNHDNYVNKIQSTLNKYPKDIKAAISILFEVDKPTPGIADKVRDLLAGFSVDIVKIKTKVKSTNKELIPLSPMNIPSTEELFKLFYHQKFPESKEIPAEILTDFKRLNSNHDGDPTVPREGATQLL